MNKKFFKILAATLFTTTILAGCNNTPASSSSIKPTTSSSTSLSSSTSSSSISTSTSSSMSSSSSSTSSSSVPVEYFFNTYSNPMSVTYTTGSDYRGEIADPSVVRGDDGYIYAFSTDRVMLRSEDGCSFEYVTGSVIDTPDWYTDVYPEETGGFHLWAPDVVKIGDKWIYYYSLSAWSKPCGVGYAVSDNIAGPYEDYGKLFDINEIGISNAIDPQVFVDDDGSVYMSVGSFQGLYLVQLTEDGMGLLNGVNYQRDNKVLIAGRPGGWDGSTYEGSYIIKRDGWYYYFGSAGTCCEGKNSSYRVYVGKSKNITGPYIDNNRKALTASGSGTTNGSLVLWAGMRDDKNVYGPGHNSVLLDDAGDYWIYYHAFSSADNYSTRHLFMDKLLWDDNGFPYIENRIPSFQEELDGPRFILE